MCASGINLWSRNTGPHQKSSQRWKLYQASETANDDDSWSTDWLINVSSNQLVFLKLSIFNHEQYSVKSKIYQQHFLASFLANIRSRKMERVTLRKSFSKCCQNYSTAQLLKQQLKAMNFSTYIHFKIQVKVGIFPFNYFNKFVVVYRCSSEF